MQPIKEVTISFRILNRYVQTLSLFKEEEISYSLESCKFLM